MIIFVIRMRARACVCVLMSIKTLSRSLDNLIGHQEEEEEEERKNPSHTFFYQSNLLCLSLFL